ncbi:MAG: hypothetical protein RIS09_1007 [Actinomycetota bacterium]
MKLIDVLRSQTGSVTAESALSLAGVLFMVVICLQSASIVAVYLQLQGATYEASQIASAFGPRAERKQSAENFLSHNIPRAQSKVHISNTTATVSALQEVDVAFMSFTIHTQTSSARWETL